MSKSGDRAERVEAVRTAPDTVRAESDPMELDNPLKRVHLLLRGRYRWAVLLMLVGGTAGAFGGFNLGERNYLSRGQVRVIPVVPKVLYGDEEKGVLPMFDAFVEAQKAIIQGDRVRDLAMENPEWVQLQRGRGDKAVMKFTKSIKATREGEFVWLTFTDQDSLAARIGVKSILTAYKQLSTEDADSAGSKRLELLQGDRTRMQNELGTLRQNILEIAQGTGSDKLESLYEFKAQELYKLESQLNDLQVALAGAAPSMRPAGEAPRELTLDEIIRLNPRVARLFDERLQLESRIRSLRFHNGDNSPAMLAAKAQLTEIDAAIDLESKDFKKRLKEQLANPLLPIPGAGKDLNVENLRARLTELQKLYDERLSKLKDIGKQNLQIKNFQLAADDVKQRLDRTKERIEELTTESKINNRITIESYGDRPLESNQDTRGKFAAAGGCGGAILGLGFIFGIALLDRRFRYPDESTGPLIFSPMLGILPELPGNQADPEQSAFASHSVHQIRGHLQLWGGGARQKVFAVTSPVAGTGKTSLTLALGISFAHANSRTLLIDADIIGAGLSSRVRAITRRRLGEILQKEGLLGEEQLREALQVALSTRIMLGEALVRHGYVNEDAVSAALALQQREPLGILDALWGENIRTCISATGIDGLDILPVGRATAEHVSQLTPEALHAVVEQARRSYDTILIDTGPMPGSLEGPVVSAEVDGVIVVISRGEQRVLAEQTVKALQSVNARVAGYVFNRAREKDMRNSGNYSRVSSATRSIAANRQAAEAGAIRLGPVAHAVAAGAPSGGGSKSRRPAKETEAATAASNVDEAVLYVPIPASPVNTSKHEAKAYVLRFQVPAYIEPVTADEEPRPSQQTALMKRSVISVVKNSQS